MVKEFGKLDEVSAWLRIDKSKLHKNIVLHCVIK